MDRPRRKSELSWLLSRVVWNPSKKLLPSSPASTKSYEITLVRMESRFTIGESCWRRRPSSAPSAALSAKAPNESENSGSGSGSAWRAWPDSAGALRLASKVWLMPTDSRFLALSSRTPNTVVWSSVGFTSGA